MDKRQSWSTLNMTNKGGVDRMPLVSYGVENGVTYQNQNPRPPAANKHLTTTGSSLSKGFNSVTGSAITGVDEKSRLGGIFANAGNNVGAKTTFSGSGSPAGEASSSKGKNKGEDDDWNLASKFMDKSFDFEKRGASIRQGIEGGQNSQNFLYGTSRAMMGLG